MAPHSEQVSSVDGFLLPQFEQNLPVFSVPQEQVHVASEAGFALPQFWQNLPVFSVPQVHFHEDSSFFFGLLLIHLGLVGLTSLTNEPSCLIQAHIHSHESIHGATCI